MDDKIKKTYVLTRSTIDLLVDAVYQIQKTHGKKIPHSTILDAAIQSFLADRDAQEIIHDIERLCPAADAPPSHLPERAQS